MVLMLLVVFHVVARIFGHPIIGTFEFVSIILAVLISFAVAYCAVLKGHIAVALVIDRFPKRIQAVVDSIVGIASLALFGLLTWQLVVFGTRVLISGRLMSATRLPIFPFIYVVSVGILVLCLVLFIDLCRSLVEVLRK